MNKIFCMTNGGRQSGCWIKWRGLRLAAFLAYGTAIWSGGSLFNGHAQTLETVVSRSDDASCCRLKTNRADRDLLNFTSATTESHLTPAKGVTLARRENDVLLAGPANGTTLNFAITAGTAAWDLSDYLYIVADVENVGTQGVTIVCRAEDPQYAGWHHFAESTVRLSVGQSTSALIFLKRKKGPDTALQKLFPGMNTLPDGYMPLWSGLDPARVTKLVFNVEGSTAPVKLALRGIRASGICDPQPLFAPGFFPFIDRFGQFLHADWTTKIHQPQDFARQRERERATLRAEPRPASWDQYGGYQDGPQLPASGHFCVAKYEGKWWLVDPAGRLFWSQGVTGVGFSADTSYRGRRQFFAELPPEKNQQTVNFYEANLKLKYGDDFANIVPELTHERLQSWGLNTLASWSEPGFTRLDKTPYTRTLFISAPKLAPALKLPDPFDPAFAANARAAFEAERDSTGKDPWCIGYFIANELEWRSDPDMVNEVLTAPASQAGKQALVQLLQQRHTSIEDLNAAWHTTYASWSALLQATNKVSAADAMKDFTAFNEELADRYYGTCERELKRATPDKLNLGSRFNTVNPIAVRAAAKYCDVVSFNKYTTSVRNLDLPGGLDRPVIIGEFHFPAWDRSFTADQDRNLFSQTQRADAYWHYVAGALDNPLIVGTHWFQYLDQPLTGRPDGENAPIGFVDVTDTPYPALTSVTRELGLNMYARRLGLNALTNFPAAAAPAPGLDSSAEVASSQLQLVTPPPAGKKLAGAAASLRRETLVYKHAGTNDLKLYVIKPPDWQATDRRPAILLFHGGGWVWGTPSIMGSEGNYFARLGMVAVLVQYRLLNKNTVAPPAMCMTDAKSAMRWVRAHAGELGVDPCRIAAGGGSAGGHLAAFLGLMNGLDDPQDDVAVSAKADALVLWNPVIDNGPGGYGHELVGDRYREFSPAQNVSSNAPPTIIFLGTKDQYVPVSTIKAFEKNMRADGVRCEAIFYDGQEHGFFNREPWHTQTLAQAGTFLASLGWIQTEPGQKGATADKSEARPPAAAVSEYKAGKNELAKKSF